MATSTKQPGQTENNPDEKYNIAQQHEDKLVNRGQHDDIEGYDRASGGLDDFEHEFDGSNNSGYGGSLDDATPEERREALQDMESPNPPKSYYNQSSNNKQKESFGAKLLAGSKRFGPTGGIVGLIFAIFGFSTVLGAPMGLLTSFSDLVSNHTSLSDHLYIKSSKSYVASFLKGQDRDCSTAKIKCKFTTISEKQKAEWEKRGIKVTDNGKNSLGRIKVSRLEYKGKQIKSIRDYNNLKYTNPEFNSLLKRFPVRAYLMEKGPFRKGTLGKFNKTLSEKFKSSKEKDKEKRAAENNKAMNSQTKSPVGEDGKVSVDKVKSDVKPKVDAASTEHKEKLKGLKGLKTATKAADIASTATVTGCMTYNIIRASQAAVTLYWHAKLIDFALPFLQAGAQAKEDGVNSGFDWETAEYAGDRLMQPITQKDIDANPDDEITQDMLGKTAMDSKGIDAVINGGYSSVNNGYAKLYNGWAPSVLGSGVVDNLQKLIGKDNIKTACTSAEVVNALTAIQCLAGPVAAIKCIGTIALVATVQQAFGDKAIELIMDEIQDQAIEEIAKANLSASLHGPPLGQALVSASGVMASYMDNASGFSYAGSNSQALTAYTDMYTDDDYIAQRKLDASQNQFDTSNQYSFMGHLAKDLSNTKWDGTVTSLLANIGTITAKSPQTFLNASAMQQGLYQPIEVYNSTKQLAGTIKNCKNPGFTGVTGIDIPCLGESGRAIPLFTGEVQGCLKQEALGGELCIEKAIDYLSKTAKYKDDNGDEQPLINENTGEPTSWSGNVDGKSDNKNPFIMFMAYCGRDRVYPLGYTDQSIENKYDNWHTGTNCISGKNTIAGSDTEGATQPDDVKLGWMSYYYNMCIALYASEEGQDYCWGDEVSLVANTTTTANWVAPTSGVCTSPFGPRWGTMHEGIDLGPPQGTPVVAPTDITILSAGYKSDGYGISVAAKATDSTGYSFRFGHLSSASVSAGSQVKKGQEIGKVGSTGNSTGPHLHFEIISPNISPATYSGEIDPIPVLSKNGVNISC